MVFIPSGRKSAASGRGYRPMLLRFSIICALGLDMGCFRSHLDQQALAQCLPGAFSSCREVSRPSYGHQLEYAAPHMLSISFPGADEGSRNLDRLKQFLDDPISKLNMQAGPALTFQQKNQSTQAPAEVELVKLGLGSGKPVWSLGDALYRLDDAKAICSLNQQSTEFPACH